MRTRIPRPSRRSLLAVGITTLTLGCLQSPADACTVPYVTAHFSDVPEARVLEPKFERAGYDWTQRTDRIADVETTGGVHIVASTRPGVSGEDLVLSAEGPLASRADVKQAMVGAAAIVNDSSAEARLEEWIEGVHQREGAC